jgi:hypothetical protein
MDASPEQTFSRLQNHIQRAILKNYPNPERRGCPDQSALAELALNPDSITADDELDRSSVWFHITHCSPCYALFLELRHSARERREKRQKFLRWLAATTAAVVLFGLGLLVLRLAGSI